MTKKEEQVPAREPERGLGLGPERKREAASRGFDEDMEALSANMDVVHELSVSGASEWDVLRLTATLLADSKGRLVGLTIAHFGSSGDVALQFRVAGLAPTRAREIAHVLNKCETIVRAKIEHMILRAKG